jgi:hypothetical protein
MKKAIIILAAVAVIVLLFIFTGHIQIGNTIHGQYYDSPPEAYQKYEDTNLNDNADKLTIDLTDNDAVWIAEIDGGIQLVQMKKDNNKYASLGNIDYIENEKQLSSDEIHKFTLTSNDKATFILTKDNKAEKQLKNKGYKVQGFYSNIFKKNINVFYKF